jgi:predicted secreted acid phosphatase
MKRLGQVLLLVSVYSLCLFAQGGPAGSANASLEWKEPENHALVVERLMDYHDYGEYDREIREVANAARDYLSALTNREDAHATNMAAVFDIDETSLSNWAAMADCGFCSYTVQAKLYSPRDHDRAIVPVLELYNFARSKRVAVFFITGRHEQERAETIKNLNDVGYSGWQELIMQPNDNMKPASVFKPEDRKAIQDKGYRIILNIGDQASDLAGCCAERVFKVPNPFYLLK